MLDFDAQNIPKVLDCGPVGNAVSHVHACDRLRSYASLRPSCRGSLHMYACYIRTIHVYVCVCVCVCVCVTFSADHLRLFPLFLAQCNLSGGGEYYKSTAQFL